MYTVFIEEQGIRFFQDFLLGLAQRDRLDEFVFLLRQVGDISPFDFSYEAHGVFPEDILIETI